MYKTRKCGAVMDKSRGEVKDKTKRLEANMD